MAETAREAVASELPRTLAVDIGGTGIKEIVLDAQGNSITERARIKTPRPALPQPIIDVIVTMAARQGEFERISVGFPGVVRNGITENAPNLDPSWAGVNLAQRLTELLGKPTRVCNDADTQGFGAISGNGVELVLTLGTGLGSALFVDGILVPNLEVAHHRFRARRTYEEFLSNAALEKVGRKKWNKRLRHAIESLHGLFSYDMLYLGGGNAEKVDVQRLPSKTQIVSNVLGLLGGIHLWRPEFKIRTPAVPPTSPDVASEAS